MRTWIIGALALAFAALTHTHAEAQSCGDGDGDDTENSGSDSSSFDPSDWNDDSSEGTTPSRPNPCAGDSGIVGDSRCSRFGGWDVSRRRAWTIGLDIGTLRLGLDDIALSGSSMHDNVPHPWNADELESDISVRAAARVRVFLHPNFFVGIEGAMGGVSLRGQTESASTRVELDSAMMFGGGLIAGAGVGLGSLRLDLELVGGRRRIVVNGTSYATDCTSKFRESFSQWTLRGGAGVSYFVRPNVSLGVHARYGFLRRELNGALSVTLHSRAYDAR